MPFDAQAAGFLAADDDRLVLHQGPNVFETDRRLVHGHTEQRRHGVHLVTGRHRANDSAGPAAVLFEVKKRQGKHLIGRQPRPVPYINSTATLSAALLIDLKSMSLRSCLK